MAPDRSILIRCLSGEASPEEAAMLDSWLNASPGNRKEFEALWQLWQKTTGGTAYAPPDAENDWQNLQVRIQPPPPVPGPVKIPVRWSMWKALSAFIAGSAITGIILITRHPSVSPQVVRHSEHTVLKDTLPNGAVITLDEQGTFSRPTPDAGRQDTVSLLNGKAYVQAAATSLAVGAGDVSIYTKDGGFLLVNDSTTGNVSIEVSRGVLEVQHGTEKYTVRKGHSLFYDARIRHFTQKNSVDTNSVAFATGVFSFTNTPLKELTAVLARAYKVDIRLNNPAIGDCRMTVQFDNLPITSVLDIIAATLNIQYSMKQQENLIYLNGKGCE